MTLWACLLFESHKGRAAAKGRREVRKGVKEKKRKRGLRVRPARRMRGERAEEEAIFAHASKVLCSQAECQSRAEQREPGARLSLSYGLPCAAQVTIQCELELC